MKPWIEGCRTFEFSGWMVIGEKFLEPRKILFEEFQRNRILMQGRNGMDTRGASAEGVVAAGPSVNGIENYKLYTMLPFYRGKGMDSPDPVSTSTQTLKQQLEVLRRVDSFMNTLTDLDQLLEQIMQESQAVTDAEASCLALYNETAGEFVFEVVLGEKGAEAKKIRLRAEEGIIGAVATSGIPMNIEDAYADGRFAARVDESTGFVTRNMLAVPMIRRGRIIGVIEVLNKRSGAFFSEEDLSILQILAHQAAITIENARLYKENIQKEHLASLGEGISGAAHCIKNIIGVLVLGASSLEYGLQRKDIKIVQDSWEPLRQGCNRISELVMDMLNYAKNSQLERAETNLNDLVRDIVAMMQPACAEKQIVIAHELDEKVGALLIDKNGIHRCIMNFFSNSMDALSKKEGAEITIRTIRLPDENAVEIQISDNGIGIPQDKIDKIFDVFFSTKGSKGTGLGLATTKKIIMEHGGSVCVSSRQGTGTTFFVRLPLA
jgi:signal transduction histidine kinase